MTRRLEVLLSHVKGPVAADIGCDHALLAAAAVKTGRAEKVYACDIAEGPLERARATIEKEGVTDSVIPLLSDGLAALPEVCDQIIIAGMGGETILSILEAGSSRMDEETRLLLSPHTKAPVLRNWLQDHGWKICLEQFVKDRGRYYPVIEACRCSQETDSRERLKPEELLFGSHPVHDEIWQLYLAHEKEKLCRLMESVPAERKEEVHGKLKLLESIGKV